jgi:hypothetical protein
MLLFSLPKQVPVSSGNTYAGAKAYFYLSGTDTAADVYTDAALTTPHSVPVVASAAGVFAPIYLNESVAYKLTLNTSADALIYTVDPINEVTGNNALTTAESTAGLTVSDIDGDYPELDVRRYGADPSGTANSTTAIANAALVAKTKTGGGTITFPDGIFKVSTIDLSNSTAEFTQMIRLKGNGRFNTKIIPSGAGGILLNLAGRNYATVEGLHFDSTGYASQCGILMSRTSTSANCNNNHFRDVWVTGGYTKAGVVSVGAESLTWDNCRFENSNDTNNYCTFWTGIDPTAINVTGSGHTLATGPNTDNVCMNCEFYSPYADAEIIHFHESAAYTMVGCLVIGGSVAVKCAVYTPQSGNVFAGPVTWLSCQMEFFGSGAGAVHYLAATGTDFFDGINNYGGYYVLDDNTAVIDYDRTAVANQPILRGCTWTTFKTAPGSAGTTMYVYGLYGTDITMRPSSTDGTLVITGLATASDVDVIDLVAAVPLTSETWERHASGVPTTGTWSQGTRIYSTAPTVGAAPGWVCTTGGTLGTLNSGNTTGGITTGTNVLTVNSATGLSAGVKISINGVSGAKIVTKVDGTTVYLNANSNATVASATVSYNAATLTAMANL